MRAHDQVVLGSPRGLAQRRVGVARAGRVVEPPLHPNRPALTVAEQGALAYHHDVHLRRREALGAARHDEGDTRLGEHRGPLHRRLLLADGSEARVLVAVDLHLRVEGDHAVRLARVGERPREQELAQLAHAHQPVLLDERDVTVHRLHAEVLAAVDAAEGARHHVARWALERMLVHLGQREVCGHPAVAALAARSAAGHDLVHGERPRVQQGDGDALGVGQVLAA
mmetsp:Transcript_2623/g.6525  ORF Transcript_2623/g.6525 Transcript_2623/m.6525 type:complete len:226 (-) Transcript_2623:304-981(-)